MQKTSAMSQVPEASWRNRLRSWFRRLHRHPSRVLRHGLWQLLWFVLGIAAAGANTEVHHLAAEAVKHVSSWVGISSEPKEAAKAVELLIQAEATLALQFPHTDA